jgi:hypothetical protein
MVLEWQADGRMIAVGWQGSDRLVLEVGWLMGTKVAAGLQDVGRRLAGE